MKQKKNESRRKDRRRVHKGERFKGAVTEVSVGFCWRGEGESKNRGWMSVAKR